MPKKHQNLFIFFGIVVCTVLLVLQTLDYVENRKRNTITSPHLNNSKTILGEETHLSPINRYTKVSASIGVPILKLFGYGPTYAEIHLNGIGITDKTIADNKGYYEFTSVFLPLEKLDYRGKKLVYPEICIIAKDISGLTSQPTCIPPLPGGYSEYEIGPVLLSPTLNLEKPKGFENETIKASGTITPNTTVTVFLAKEERHVFELIQSVSAYYLPSYELKSDTFGKFEFNLPTDNPEKWKIFVASNYQGSNSPKSNTLNYRVLPWFYVIFQSILNLLSLLKPYLYWLLIIIEVILVLVLFSRLKTSKKKKTPTPYSVVNA